MMQIFCRQCGAEIKAADINLDSMMAKCASCNAVFSFADMYEGITPKSAKRKAYDEVPLPKGISVQNDGFQLEITRTWFGCSTIAIGGFSLIWNGMLWLIFVPVMLSQGLNMEFLFLLPFLAIGIGLLYWTLAGIFNITVIRVDNEKLVVQSGPVPVPGNKTVAAHDIEQIYTKQQVHRGSDSTTYTYELHAVTYEGKKQKLVGNLYDSDQALYIEQEVERFLGIEDRPVRGEYR
jgi:hypothetical protein